MPQPHAGWALVPGHNPIGALSVLALLGLLGAQIVLGLFAVDVDGIESGPLSNHVSFETGRVCARVHHQLFNVLLAVIAVHLIAVAYYLLAKKQDLVGAMVHGKRDFAAEMPQVQNASLVRFIVGVGLAAALTFWITHGG